jgi:hypothetical protein
MSRPDTRVRIAFDLAAGGVGDFFTLDDPVKGELDDGPFGLAGDILEDVTDDVRSITVRRGRSRELERYQAGAATVNLDNKDRTYDPSYKVTQSATGGDTVGTVDVSGVEYVAHEYTTAGTAAFTPGIPLLRGVQVLTDRVNLATNPSIETDTTLWTISGTGTTIARITTDSLFGSACLQVTKADVANSGAVHANASGSRISVSPSTTYRVSVYVKVPTGQATSGLRTRITQFTAVTGGSTVSTTNGTTVTVTDTQGWVRLNQTITTGSTTNAISVFAVQTTAGTAGQLFLIDGLLIEQTSLLRPYFDGGIYDDNTVTATTAWTGTANNSTSTATALQNVGEVTAPFNVNVDTGKVVVRYPQVAFPSPFVASMRPRKVVQITTAGQPVFNGVVDDWDLDYSLNNDHMASVKITDGFVFLAGQEIEPHTATAQATGARINAILDRAEIAWPPGKRAIDTGSSTLQADAIGGTANAQPVPALPYLQKVEEAEQGALFIGADGALTFRDRGSLQTLTTDTVFTDDGTGIPFTNINAAYGAEELRNRVTVSRLNGGTATAVDAASVTAYGAIDFEIRDSLLADDTQAQSLADAIVARYAEPLLRIDDIEVVLNALTPAQVDQVLALELGALVRVLYTPSGIGDPIDQFVRLDQIEHNITAEQHRVRLSFSQGEPPALVLDSATFGLLDVNTLGF